jgi:hypothetical protein
MFFNSMTCVFLDIFLETVIYQNGRDVWYVTGERYSDEDYHGIDYEAREALNMSATG